MVDKVNIELDEPFLKKFFGLTEKIIPDGQEITLAMMRKQLDEIEHLLSESKAAASQAAKGGYTPPTKPSPSSHSSFDDDTGEDEFNLPKKNILVIDDLGVITYQLSVLFKQQLNYEVTTSKEIYDAIEKFKKQPFDLVVMDLFIPTEREGFILLEELKKIATTKQKPTKIGVMSASAKKEHKQMCKMKGAEFYIEKIDDWQKELFGVIKHSK